MSTIKLCDACGEKILTNINIFSYLCHIEDLALNSNNAGYVDNDGNGVSGRVVNKDLCNSCYNLVMVAAYKKMMEIVENK